MLAQLQQLLGRSETLWDFLQQELEAWRERQQRACLGAAADTALRPLETWWGRGDGSGAGGLVAAAVPPAEPPAVPAGSRSWARGSSSCCSCCGRWRSCGTR